MFSINQATKLTHHVHIDIDTFPVSINLLAAPFLVFNDLPVNLFLYPRTIRAVMATGLLEFKFWWSDVQVKSDLIAMALILGATREMLFL